MDLFLYPENFFSAYNTLRNTLLQNCSQNELVGLCNVPQNASLFEGGCFVMTAEQKAQFPVFQILFEGGASLEVTPGSEDDLRSISCYLFLIFTVGFFYLLIWVFFS
jgi:hypothetical protein